MTGRPVSAVIDGGSVRFEEPQVAVAPGQTVAFYRGDEVLGGAIIEDTVA